MKTGKIVWESVEIPRNRRNQAADIELPDNAQLLNASFDYDNDLLDYSYWIPDES